MLYSCMYTVYIAYPYHIHIHISVMLRVHSCCRQAYSQRCVFYACMYFTYMHVYIYAASTCTRCT